jgi:hypothetical protein
MNDEFSRWHRPVGLDLAMWHLDSKRVTSSFYKSFASDMDLVGLPALSSNLQTPFLRDYVADAMQSFAAYVAQQLQSVAESARPLLESMALEERLARPLADRGWLLFSLIQVDVLRDVEIALEHNPERVDELLTAYYRDNLDDYLSETAESHHCAPWRAKIESAYRAHASGDYDLAVPLWLIIIDGVARTIARDRNFKLYTEVQSVQSYRGRVRKLFPGDRAEHSWSERLIQVLHLLSRGEKHSKRGIGVNRAAILHGLDPDFGTERESLQCILTLHLLCVLGGDEPL